MKVRIDPLLCQGHALCQIACPELIKLQELDGHAYVLSEDVPPELETRMTMARDGCPEEAIELFD